KANPPAAKRENRTPRPTTIPPRSPRSAEVREHRVPRRAAPRWHREGTPVAERLQKLLSRAGISSRRKAEELISEGRGRVNGMVVKELGSRANPATDRISVDGRPLRLPSEHTYLLLHKPVGVVTTLSDPEGRQTVIDLLGGVRARVYPVGRLDYHSSGLLL